MGFENVKAMAKKPISLVVVTLNEAPNIERCLRSAPFVSEILVVDSFSSDRTVQIAQDLGARVVQEKWRGFGAQKRFAADLANNDWILSLDADEALSPDLAAEIQKKFESLDANTGYIMPRKSFFLGRWILHGGWYPDGQLRLFNRERANWEEASVHERVKVSKTEWLTNPILHWVFTDISDQVETNDRYSTLQALERHKRGEKFSVAKMLIKPWVKFIETYFWKRGFLDGLPGLIIAINASYSLFMRWSKMWELEQKDKS